MNADSEMLEPGQPEDNDRQIVHVEVCMTASCTETAQDIKHAVERFLGARYSDLHKRTGRRVDVSSVPFLAKNVEQVLLDPESDGVKHTNVELMVHAFQLAEEGADEEALEGFDSTVACRTWSLPSKSFHGLWDSLVFDDDIRSTLVDYCQSAMLFADHGIDSHIITWNRLVLLHGPPGTGKTSLAKALAHKLSIRLSSRFPIAHLVEINAHSLFSKWFSESGKLVLAMFKKISELLDDSDCFVCVLIDEVESLTSARASAMAGSEPSDAIRVVNALLTQLDAIKSYPNVLVLTTSNLPEGIDTAFVDRADLKLHVGFPGLRARYNILASCIAELLRTNILKDSGIGSLLDFESVSSLGAPPEDPFAQVPRHPAPHVGQAQASMLLLHLCGECEGVSGRFLRKLPFTAYATHVKKPACLLSTFLFALRSTAQAEVQGRKQFA